MNKKNYILVFISFFMLSQIFSQKCPPSYLKGTFSLNENEEGTFCYIRMPDQKIENNIYHTKYSFITDGRKETYQLDFYFYKSLDSISIIYKNIQTGYSEMNFTKFDRDGSVWMFKDYKANDPNINRYDNYSILFTIPELAIPYITLNQFQLPDKKEVLFKVSEINYVQLQAHIAEAKLYIIQHKNDNSGELETHKKAVKDLLNEMARYRDSLINKLTTDEQEFSKNGRPVEADNKLSEIFTSQLNPIFINYFKTIFPYQDYNSKIEFVFICDVNGKIKTAIDIRSINSLQLKWFEDSFKLRVLPVITVGTYKNVTETWRSPSLSSDFNKMFLERINKLKPDPGETSEFNQLKTQTYKEFEKYQDKEINSPTKYTYRINYQSIVKYEAWEYKVNKKGIETLGPVNSGEIISDELKNLFRNKKIIRRKETKYNIKRCDVLINNELKGQDLLPNQTK